MGKTTLVELASGLLDAAPIKFGSRDDFERIKTRLLSEGAIGQRIVLLDNLKQQQFSSEELEAC